MILQRKGAKTRRKNRPGPVFADKPDTAVPASPANVVLVHGVWLPAWSLAPLARRLRARGYLCHLFSYHSVGRDLEDNARRLQRYLDTLAGTPVHLVGHSLGGILIRSLFRDYPDQRPGRIVMLATPLNGSVVASRLAASRFGGWLIGRSLRQLVGERPGWERHDREVGMIAGTLGIGIGRFLVPGFAAESDGTVAVAETRAAVTDHIHVPGSHTTMLFSAEVAAQICRFLQSGRFRH